MCEVTTNPNARAGAMGERTLGLVVDTLRQVSEPDTSTYSGNVVRADSDVLEGLEVDDQGAIRASGTEGRIGMASTLSLHLDAVLRGANDGIGNVLGSGRNGDGGGSVLEAKIVWLGPFGKVGSRRRLGRDAS